MKNSTRNKKVEGGGRGKEIVPPSVCTYPLTSSTPKISRPVSHGSFFLYCGVDNACEVEVNIPTMSDLWHWQAAATYCRNVNYWPSLIDKISAYGFARGVGV